MNGTPSNVCFASTRSAPAAENTQPRISKKDIWKLALHTSVWLAVSGSSLKKTELCVRTQSKFACNHQPVDKTTGKIDKDCFLQSCTSGPQEFGGRSEWRFLVWCPMEQCNSGLPISERVVIRSSHMPLSECFFSQSYTGSVFRHC